MRILFSTNTEGIPSSVFGSTREGYYLFEEVDFQREVISRIQILESAKPDPNIWGQFCFCDTTGQVFKRDMWGEYNPINNWIIEE